MILLSSFAKSLNVYGLCYMVEFLSKFSLHIRINFQEKWDGLCTYHAWKEKRNAYKMDRDMKKREHSED
jgi:hypothetical protein